MAGTSKPPGKKLNERRDRRKRVSAVGRVGVLHPDPVTGVGGAARPQAFQRFARPRVGKAENRRGPPGRGIEGQQSAAVTRNDFADRPRVILRLERMALGERCVEETHDGNVQSVEPDHRPVRFASVVVPRSRWGDDEVALSHQGLLAVHCGVGALPLHDEAKGGLGVAVGGSDLARQDELQAGVQ